MAKSIRKEVFIDNEELAREFLEDASVLGIQTSLEAHRFIWLINRSFRLDLRYQRHAEIVLTKKAKSFWFPYYMYVDAVSQWQHIVYVNQHDGEYLLPDLKHFDFLWLAKADTALAAGMQHIAQLLRQTGQVQMVAELPGEKIKFKQRLVI